VFETMYFLPYVIAVVPAALSWKFIYDPTNGVLNYILGVFGMAKQAWLINEKLALGSIIVMSIWQRIGYNMVIFTVGLGGIPKDYYEAARVDGASYLQIFKKITLPLLMPVTMYLFIMNTIEAFNIFTPVYVMTTGTQSAPGSVIKVLVLEIYQNAFRFFKMGYASAQSVCLFAIVLVVSLLQFSTFGKKER
jgi:multiple sugar transport system permease protein